MPVWPKRKKTARKKTSRLSVGQLLVWRQVVVGSILVVCIGSLLAAVWHVTRIESWQITDVSVVGGFTISHSAIKEVTERELTGTYLKLVPRRFGLTYPADQIVAGISQIDRIKAVRLERQDQTLHVAFEEYQPLALWCKAGEGEGCWFIDQTGLAFAMAPELSGSAFVRYATDREPELGITMGDDGFIEKSQAFIELAERTLGLFVTQIERVDELDIQYTVAGGGQIKVSQLTDSVELINNLQSILTAPEFVHIEAGNFNYIDLRFGDKVFVSEVEVVDTTTASSTE